MSNDSPDRIGRYEVLEEIGSGSMGRVYLARDPTIDRKLALKVLAPAAGLSAADEAELRDRFILEARAAGRVEHPGIVTVYDAETDGTKGLSYIAMEWVEGESLETALSRGALAPAQVARLGIEVALALDAAHEAGLVHRDVKPANILLDRRGRARISDFGIAKFAAKSSTQAGRLLGSPFYMAPEQVRNEPVDRRSDLFSLGSVLYQAATGQVPFGGESLAGISYKILEIDPPRADVVAPRVEPVLASILAKALSKDPNARFQSGKELARALARVAPRAGSQTPSGTLILDTDRAPAVGDGWLRRHRGALVAASLPLVALLLWLLVASRPAAEESATAARAEIEDSATPALATRPEPAAPEPEPTAEPVAEPVVEPPSSPPPQPVAAATTGPAVGATAAVPPRRAIVDLRYRNHLRSGRLTVRVDDVEVWSGEVGEDQGWLGRVTGNDVWPRITVPPGKHVIGVHIVGSDGTVDASKRIWAVFEPGSRQRLKVKLVPPRLLRLSWED